MWCIYNGLDPDNSVLISLAEYNEKVVSRSSSDCLFCEIFDHEGNKITVSQLLEKYYFHKNGVVGDDQETEARLSSPGQTKPILDVLMLESAENEHRSSDLKQEAVKEKSPPCLALFQSCHWLMIGIVQIIRKSWCTGVGRKVLYAYLPKSAIEIIRLLLLLLQPQPVT
ncbi:MAG TPA: hypothetical protein VGE97_00700 [Nitrososphaera sp.]|jgi:hypothetical protein